MATYQESTTYIHMHCCYCWLVPHHTRFLQCCYNDHLQWGQLCNAIIKAYSIPKTSSLEGSWKDTMKWRSSIWITCKRSTIRAEGGGGRHRDVMMLFVCVSQEMKCVECRVGSRKSLYSNFSYTAGHSLYVTGSWHTVYRLRNPDAGPAFF